MNFRYLALGDSYTIGESVDVAERFPNQLAALLAKVNQPSYSAYAMFRLSPTAPPETEKAAEASKERASLTKGALRAGRRAGLDLVEASLDERTIEGETLSAWMRTLNDVRLVLGTRLEITDDEQPPPAPWDGSFPTWRVYALLGVLVHEAVLALRSEL